MYSVGLQPMVCMLTCCKNKDESCLHVIAYEGFWTFVHTFNLTASPNDYWDVLTHLKDDNEVFEKLPSAHKKVPETIQIAIHVPSLAISNYSSTGECEPGNILPSLFTKWVFTVIYTDKRGLLFSISGMHAL